MNEDRTDILASQVRRTGYCTHPIRLRGHVDAVNTSTGELTAVLDSSTQPGGALLVACRNRRATVCPSCSNRYRGDAWQLIAAGLRGGKGIPDGVATHPRVFATFTAPSFGPVHSRREADGKARTCRPRRSGVCPHNRPHGCRLRHEGDDPSLGQPLCPACFDYVGAVVWNAHVGPLWNRTAIGIRRALADAARVTIREFGQVARLSFIKVVEYQARGVVHLHSVVRLDGPSGGTEPPPPELGVDEMVKAINTAGASASIPLVLPDGTVGRAMWGHQLDVRPLLSRNDDRDSAIAAYIAKYATKSTDALGALDHRIRNAEQIERLVLNAHLRQLVVTCWALGGDPQYRKLRLRAWAHTLGYRGHWTTKSRRYSTTFSALRDARARHQASSRTEGPSDPILLGEWRYAGRGYGYGIG